ncbi:type II toxin-antitoxin system HicA family toxin [Kiloniella laminariae]|uniref:Type II toxin-antitoxin system HicA family toxin n=1 Tax=Kiloniella laminariae TaxID=454162 RepID=A0ABT4LKP5_9PROT|nr:type II toxin-antitoxin system HicA family toxin [Kiloniella laminariae]MCZ4281680.1 type II toxin-antitoxin system HicA family toxin [Kiloniella laminariae]
MTTSKEVKRVLEQNGWTLSRVKGSHHIFKHPGKGIVILPHPKSKLGTGLLRDMERKTGLKLR